MTEEKAIRDADRHTSVLRQFANSAVGEITSFTLSIGAVYMAEKIAPERKAAFIASLTQRLGKTRGISPETQAPLANMIVDVGVMNIAGAAGMGMQYGLRRAHQPEEDRTPLWYELGRLVFGRVVGTVTALGGLSIATTKAPGAMKAMQNSVSHRFGGSAKSDRFAELLVSNAVQAVGAVAGNAPAQLLYDCVTAPHDTGHSR